MLGERFLGLVWVEMDEFPTFWCFWAKLAIVDRISRVVVAVEGADVFEIVADDVNNEKTGIFRDISLVEPIFAFLLFPGITGDCDVATRVRGLISRCWDILVSVWVPMVAIEADSVEKVAGTRVGDDGGTWMM